MYGEEDYTHEVSEFKGNKVISIKRGENRVITFGLNKARAILSCKDAIEKFVEDNTREQSDEEL